MTGAPVVEVAGLTKRYGSQAVVDDLSFTVEPGRVTGFLGPNGAGKTTTLRMLLGLAAPTAGEARVLGRRFTELESPSRTVGALIDASGFHRGRRARDELAIHAAAAGLDTGRVDVVLEEVGLAAAGGKRVGQLSLGMRQRLGLGAALLGQPALLLLDEPANGLDPAGMHWLRDLLRRHAEGGGAVFVSSHVLAELALFADDVVVIDKGRLVAQSSVEELEATGGERVFVASADARLATVLQALDATVEPHDDGYLVSGTTAAEIGAAVAEAGVALHQLRTEARSLEEVFLRLTENQGSIR
jgi:ABC-2 type transport system ATP-binding protein